MIARAGFDPDSYAAFLRAKIATAPRLGLDVAPEDVNPLLKPHQRAMVLWAVRGGRRAIFAAFGLGKTVVEIEVIRLVLECLRHTAAAEGGRGLIVAPLGVRQEFFRDAHMLATGEHPAITDAQRAELRAWQQGRPDRIPHLRFVRRIEEAEGPGIYLTNYETIRDGKMDPCAFAVASLDEASVLRGFGGTKTFREFMRLFDGMGYKFVATATPSPNDFIELLAYAAFLEIMDVGQGKTRFFRRNSEKADHLTLHPHKEREFWLWVASWGLFVQRPSDLGFPNEGYELPPLEVHWHEVPCDHLSLAGQERDGQQKMFADTKVSVQSAAKVKRESLEARIAKLLEIRAKDPAAHRIIWHDLEAERRAIERAVPGAVSIYGSQDLGAREKAIIDFSDGCFAELAAKPVIAGSGCNFQRHCAWEIFLGIGFKFNDFIQAIHRVYRFLQIHPVRIDIIYSEAERGVRKILEEKWARHNEMVEIMSEIIQKYGLTEAAMAQALARSLGVERVEVAGEGYHLVNNDCVVETAAMESDSVHLIVTSIPFSTQYEYTPSYNDFGHTDDNAHFWAQMDFLTPELLRVLQPGRVAAIHVKDRIVPGGINGLGFQSLHEFSDECVAHFKRHGFAYLGRKTIVTDVVRENNQTYRLGWTEQCKDGSRMGCGVPEYLLLFRRPPTDRTNGYADVPVVKEKPLSFGEDGEPIPFERNRRPVPGTGYSRARWQLDAHALMRSSGDRLLTHEELQGLPADAIYKTWRRFSLEAVYDFEHHVRIGEELDAHGKLPPTFMLLPPHSWHPAVWADVTRMLTLNGSQAAKGKEMHLCPLQFDVVDRAVVQYTMEGETVFDPFGGLFTVPLRAVKLRRRGRAVELNPGYFLDGCAYVRAAAEEMGMPSLFDFLDEAEAPAGDPAGLRGRELQAAGGM